MNRRKILEGMEKLYRQEQLEKIEAIKKVTAEEMEMDERILVLRALKEAHPFLSEEFEDIINTLIKEECSKKVEHIKTYFEYDYEKVILARLHLMPNELLSKYTLEELLSLMKP